MISKELNKLKELDIAKQKTFAWLTSERLFRNYLYFSTNFNFGNPAVLRQAIDCLRDCIFLEECDKDLITLQIEKVSKIMPDTDNFQTVSVSAALDACATVLDSLNFMIDGDFSRIVFVSSYASDTVDMFVQEVDSLDINLDLDFEAKIANHPLMKRERSIQAGIVAYLAKKNIVEPEDLNLLLELQGSASRSNIDL